MILQKQLYILNIYCEIIILRGVLIFFELVEWLNYKIKYQRRKLL